MTFCFTYRVCSIRRCTSLLLTLASVLLPLSAMGQTTITVNSATTYQTIDGFGGYGGRDVWWSGGPYYNDDFVTLLIDDLGMTINREEWICPGNVGRGSWDVQRPYLQALRDKAAAHGEPIKFMATIWSPPAEWKSNHSSDGGGELLPEYYDDYGNYLVNTTIKSYDDAAIPLYALSPQNEPDTGTFYQSCVYTRETYRDMFEKVAPIIHNSGTSTRVIAAEHYQWTGCCDAYSFEVPIIEAGLDTEVDLWALHDYDDIDAYPDYNSKWAHWYERAHGANNKNVWQTESAGFDYGSFDAALQLARKIQLSLIYGHISAWIYWQLGESTPQPTSLIPINDPLDARYYALKHFARFIRPGAVMVDATRPNDQLLVTAFKRACAGGACWAIQIVNLNNSSQALSLAGSDLPAAFDVYQTTSSQNCVKQAAQITSSITVPARSITTLVAGDFHGGENTPPPVNPRPTVTLTANPTQVQANGSTTLTWSSTNATSCTASDGWSGTKSLSGSEVVTSLTATTTFTLSCTGPGGSGRAWAQVTVAGSTCSSATNCDDGDACTTDQCNTATGLCEHTPVPGCGGGGGGGSGGGGGTPVAGGSCGHAPGSDSSDGPAWMLVVGVAIALLTARRRRRL